MSSGSGSARGDAAALAIIAAGAAAVAAAIGIHGDFPLSDDWSYAYSARSLCTDGTLRFLPWTGASVVLQAGYGALLCRLFGFSFSILRLSTVVLAASGAIAFHLLLGRAGVRGAARGLATALFALNPLYVNLAFTFMTDAPCTAIAVWAGYCYVRGLDEDRRGWLVAGSLLAAGALLIRQHGIFVAAGATLATLLAGNRTWRARCSDALAAGVPAAVVFVAFHVWLFTAHGAPGAMETKLSEARHVSLAGIANCAFRGIETLGLLLAPLALAARRDLVTRHPRAVATVTTVLATLAVLLYLRLGATMFYLTNVMYDFGLGASSLRDTLFLGLRQPLELGPTLTLPLTALATVTGGVLVSAALGAWPRLREPVPAFLALAAGLLFLGTLLHTRYYFDRYLLIVVPFAIAAVCVSARLHPSRVSVALAAALAWYAVAGTHDYLAWNRARNAGLTALLESGVSAREIDGGMEFNAWHLAAPLGTWPTDAQVRPGQPPTAKSWWWVVDDRFVATFRELPGYRVHQLLAYPRWLVPGTGRVVILERNG